MLHYLLDHKNFDYYNEYNGGDDTKSRKYFEMEYITELKPT